MAMPSFKLWAGYGPGNEGSEADITSWVVTSFLLGCIGGSCIAGWMADALGRKPTIVLGGLAFTIGGAVQAAAGSLTVLYLSRTLSGVAIGALSMVAPLLIAETAPAAQRGMLVALEQLLITIGILTASVVNSVLYVYYADSGDYQWRTALAVQALPGVLLLLVVLPMPRSPRWLASKGRTTAAASALARLRGVAVDDPLVTSELGSIQEEIARDSAASGGGPPSWRDLLAPRARRPITVAVILQVCQQMTGINVALYFAPALWDTLGIPPDTAATWLVVANAAVLVVATLPGLALLELRGFGRRWLLIGGGIAMAAMHALVATSIAIAQGGGPAGPTFSWIGVGAMFAFTAAFSATWGPAVWVVQSEVMPLDVRARGGALATVANWASNAVIGKAAPYCLAAFGPATYGGFAVACVLMTIYVRASLPETAGVPLEDIGALFVRGSKALPHHKGELEDEEGEGSASVGMLGAGVAAAATGGKLPVSSSGSLGRLAADGQGLGLQRGWNSESVVAVKADRDD